MSNPSGPLTEKQVQLLADRLFQAAAANASKAESPPDPMETGEYVAAQARNYAEAAKQLTQAFMTIHNRGRR